MFEPPPCFSLLGDMNSRVAESNREIPASMRPPRKLPVLLLIAPIAKGPTKPPMFPIELIRAIPTAAEDPARKVQGRDQNGPMKLNMPIATRHHSMIKSHNEDATIVPIRNRAMAATISGKAA